MRLRIAEAADPGSGASGDTMMNDGHRHQEELCAYVEGTLSTQRDAEVEQHLAECVQCAGFADSYARFLMSFESATDQDPELDAATARLDARMGSFLQGRPAGPERRSTEMLRCVFGITELVTLASQRLRDLASRSAILQPQLPDSFHAWAAPEPAPSEIPLHDVRAVDAAGVEFPVEARLAYSPHWPSERIDLLVELDLAQAGWGASVSYLLDAPQGQQAALLLFEGHVDEEGLIEILRRWDGPTPQSFEPERLRICLTHPRG
jgi:hypothetical protein